jgi:hypothetical protein
MQAITEHGLYQRTPDQIPDGQWGAGMVTLVGDAAHTAYVDGTGLALSLGEHRYQIELFWLCKGFEVLTDLTCCYKAAQHKIEVFCWQQVVVCSAMTHDRGVSGGTRCD